MVVAILITFRRLLLLQQRQGKRPGEGEPRRWVKTPLNCTDIQVRDEADISSDDYVPDSPIRHAKRVILREKRKAGK